VVGLAATAEVGVRQFDVRQAAEQSLKEAPQLQAGQAPELAADKVDIRLTG
jgi:hypothetical protein